MCTTLKLIKVNSERSFWRFIPHSVLAFGLCVSDRPPLLSCVRYWVLVEARVERVYMSKSFSTCSIRCLEYIVMLGPSSLNWPVQARIKSFSVRILVCVTLIVLRCDRMSFFYKWSRENNPLSPGNVEIQYITFFFRKRYKRTKKRNHA